MNVPSAVFERGYEAVATAGHRFRLSRPQFTRRNAVVMYHSVREPEDIREETSDVSIAELRRHLNHFVEAFEVVDLPAVYENGDSGRAGKRIALTFDDGYRDFYTNVRPLLHEFDVPATVFVIPGFLDNANRREQVMNTGHLFDVITSEQVADLADDPLVTIGNHTRTHHDIGTHHERDIIEGEVVGAKEALENEFDITVDRFCYPNGGFNETGIEVVRNSHTLATVDESRRPLSGSEDPVRLPRVDGGLPFDQVKWRLSDANGVMMRVTRRVAHAFG
jgi:peptidoglycan/xylan/chitin deacetylase (PgdA/CDA1 family)